MKVSLIIKKMILWTIIKSLIWITLFRRYSTDDAIYRYISYAADKLEAAYVFLDLGPNLGALNRSVLGGCDYFITPLSPDLFSIKEAKI